MTQDERAAQARAYRPLNLFLATELCLAPPVKL